MKKLSIITFCLFVLSVATTWAQYSYNFSACVSTDVNQPEVTNDPIYPNLIGLNNGNLVYMRAVGRTYVQKYRGTGTIQASLWMAIMADENGSTIVSSFSASSSRGSAQSGYTSDYEETYSNGAYLEGVDVKASTKGSVEGYACSIITVTW